MNPIERGVRRLDHLQQRHPVPAFIWAVIQKFGNDQAGALATRVAYHGLFSIFPLLLLLTSILGFVLEGNPTLQHQVLNSALANIPILGYQLQHQTGTLQGSGAALAVGVAGLLYGTFGIGQSAQEAMNGVWNIPYVDWPNFFLRRLKALAVVGILGLATVASTGLAIIAGHLATGIDRPLAYVGSVLVSFAVFLAAFLLLTAEPLTWRDVMLGVVLATAFWQALQWISTWYIPHTLRHASSTYGTFAIIIALLSWMYLAAQLTLLAAEINVVRKYHLWPRSITQPPLTDGDRRTFDRLARMEVRRPEYDVRMELKASADDDPLRHDQNPAPQHENHVREDEDAVAE